MMHTVATLITDKAFAECLMIFNACKGSFLVCVATIYKFLHIDILYHCL